MKSASNWQDFVAKTSHDFVNHDTDKRILSFMKNAPVFAATASIVFDEIKQQQTGIELTAYHSGDFLWDSRDIYYYENYGMPLNADFVNYVLNQ